MKKILLILPILLITGCVNKSEVLETSAKTYYENHMKMINNIDSVTITLEDLINAEIEDEYDLSKLKKCKETSKVIFYINKETKEIENKKIELDC